MKILITGSNGFIGTNLVNKLKLSHKIVQQRRTIGSGSVLNASNLFAIDLDGKSNWKECLTGIDTIVHLAAVAHNNSDDPDYINEVNVEGTINLAQQAAANNVRRFVFISSIGVIGNESKLGEKLNESSIAAPKTEYAKSKLEAENRLLELADKTDLEVVIIRPVLVYGAGAPGNFGKLVNLVNKVRTLPFGLCRNKRSFISIYNLVDFISICIEHPNAKNEIFCISDDHGISTRQFTDAIAKGLNKRLIHLPIPVCIFRLMGKLTNRSGIIEQLIGDLQVDSSKARDLLGWTPPYSITETLSKLKVKK